MGSARLAPALSAGHRFGTCFCCLREAGAPEFEQVVGGCDQLPFGLARAEAATEEAVGAADAFRVRRRVRRSVGVGGRAPVPRVARAPPRFAALRRLGGARACAVWCAAGQGWG